MFRAAGYLICVVLTAFATSVVLHIIPIRRASIIEPFDVEISYADFIVILLTCVVILITILGIGIAILTVFGMRNVRTTARQEAYLTAKKELENPESSIARSILKIAERSAYEGVEAIHRKNGDKNGEYD